VTRARAALVLALAFPLAGGGCEDQVITSLQSPGVDVPTDGGPVGSCGTTLVGFATVEGGTVGGQGGPTVVVSTALDLKTNAASVDPLVIQVSGMISNPTGQIHVKSNKTIVGLGAGSGLAGGGLDLTDGENIIIRNLVITQVVGDDAISVTSAKHVWVDHCDLSSDLDHGKDYYDGLVDITHGSDDVTVSWTRFHDHYHVSLIGHSDDNGSQDTGHLTVTFHHNLFENTYSYNPTIRFGSLHAYDNTYRNLLLNGISSRMGAQVLAEENTFDNVPTPLTTQFESPTDGFLQNKENVFINSPTIVISQTSTWTPPYSYVAEPAATAATLVDACVGTGKI
jgi:pectate lyase